MAKLSLGVDKKKIDFFFGGKSFVEEGKKKSTKINFDKKKKKCSVFFFLSKPENRALARLFFSRFFAVLRFQKNFRAATN